MKIEVNYLEHKKRLDFPKLMYSDATNSVYFCTAKGKGIKLVGDSKFTVGEYIDYLDTDCMGDFFGHVTLSQ